MKLADHLFVPGYGDPTRCCYITEGATWTVADPYYCRRPADEHPNWNTVADAGLLNPTWTGGRGLGFVAVRDVKRLPKPDSGFKGLAYQLTKLDLRGRFYWWRLTGEAGPDLVPRVEWCGRGRDPRPWWTRLLAACRRHPIYQALDFRFGHLRRR